MSHNQKPLNEAELRDRILDEAVQWIGTPWHHEARVRGAGVDCAQLLIAVYAAAGLIEEFDLPHYPPDWHLHRDDPRFLNELLQHCKIVESALPGDIVMFQYGRHAAHGSIYMGNDRVIHSWRDEGRVTITELKNSPLTDRVAGIYRWTGFA